MDFQQLIQPCFANGLPLGKLFQVTPRPLSSPFVARASCHQTPVTTDLDGCKVFEPTDSTEEGAQSSLCKVGFYATPRQFVSKAKALNHPMDADNPVSDWVKRAIFSMMTVDPASLALQCATRLKQILTWKSQLEKDEQKLTNSASSL